MLFFSLYHSLFIIYTLHTACLIYWFEIYEPGKNLFEKKLLYFSRRIFIDVAMYKYPK